jgi:hypothetical protein
MCVIVGNSYFKIGSRIYIVRHGVPNATISMNFGDYIKSLSFETK